jgi:Uncharacterized MobA-related protein
MITDAIILAAGYSSRAGTNKLLLKLGDKTILERCIENLSPFCHQIIVVGGYRIEDLESILSSYDKIKLVYNPHFSDGMYSSVKKGLEHIKGQRFLLTPGDIPLIQKLTIERILEMDTPIAIPEFEGETGHPVLIQSSLIPDILRDNHRCLRDFVTSQNPEYINVVDRGILNDIDYMNDYYEILKQWK